MTISSEMAEALERIPPLATEAEFAVIGSVLVEPERLELVRNILPDGSWFFRPANRAVYDAMIHVASKNGGAVDIVLLNQHLEDTGDIKLVGGVDYLVECATSFPSALNAVHYAKCVREKHLTFRALMAAGDLVYRLQDRPDEARERLASAIQQLKEIQEGFEQFSPSVQPPAAKPQLNGRMRRAD